jgi:Fic family protein
MADLLRWVKETKVHPLISSCVFHYEFEFIHPFADGNGRMGRMWQTLLLMQWKPVFAWIPVETIVKEHQQDYYAAIAQSDHEANSSSFITFMLQCLKQALQEMEESNQKSNQKSDQKILSALRHNPFVTIRELQGVAGLSESGVKKIIRQLKAEGLIRRVGGDKGGHWEI